MTQIAKVVGMAKIGDLLLVQAMAPKDEFKAGGTMYGFRYEWGVNHYAFTECKEATMEAYGLTEDEWEHWDALYVSRFDWGKDDWYTVEAEK